MEFLNELDMDGDDMLFDDPIGVGCWVDPVFSLTSSKGHIGV